MTERAKTTQIANRQLYLRLITLCVTLTPMSWSMYAYTFIQVRLRVIYLMFTDKRIVIPSGRIVGGFSLEQ
jgi:hypothetical protein